MLPGVPASVSQFAFPAFSPNPEGAGGTLTVYADGVVLAVWDAKDKNGAVVPNGFYHVVIHLRLADGTDLLREKDIFIHDQGSAARGQLTVEPNLAGAGELVRIFATVGEQPAGDGSQIRIYTVGGELVKTLAMAGGQSIWDLTTGRNQPAASGLYLVVLRARDPATGAPVTQTAKVVVRR